MISRIFQDISAKWKTSLAGATAKTHNSIRMNSDFELLLENIRFLNAVKKEKRLDKPKLHIVYLMLKDNIRDVPAIVEQCRTCHKMLGV